MPKSRTTLLLLALTLTLCVGTASAQISIGLTPLSLTFTPGGGNPTSGTVTIGGGTGGDGYTLGGPQYAPSGTSWLAASSSSNGSMVPDVLTINLDPVQAATLGAGSYSATILVTDTADQTTATITVNLTVTASLSAGALGSSTLTRILGGAASQPASQTTVTVSNSDASSDSFTIVRSNCPTWLTITGSPVAISGSSASASSSAAETLSMFIDPTQLGGVTAGTSVNNCSVALQYNGIAFSTLSFIKLAVNGPAQLTATSPAAVTFTPGGGTLSATSTIANGTSNDAYTVGTVVYNPAGTSWLSASTSANNHITSDTLTVHVNPVTAATLAPGSYSATVPVTDSVDLTTASITVNLTVSASLSGGAPGKTVLTYVVNGGASQPAASTTVTVSNTDTSADSFTIVPTSCPAWLTITGSPVAISANTATAISTAAEILTLFIDPTKLNGVPVPTTVNTCSVALKYNGVAFSTATFTNLSIVSQPLVLSNPTSSLGYNKGLGTASPSSTSVTVSVAAGTASTPFALDLATLPAWLTVSSGLTNNGANATVGGNTVTFAVNTAVAAGLATGNYTANVGFFATGYADVKAAISFQISNAAPGITVLPAAQTNVSFTTSMTVPSPTATVYSTDEPISFTATCTVQQSAAYTPTSGYATPCILNGAPNTTATNVVDAQTFTWGYGLTAKLDPVMFSATLGNTIRVTITFTNVSNPPSPVVYFYTLQPGLPTATGTLPSSLAAGFSHSNSPVVVVKGSNFIGTQNLATAGGIVQTQVWLGGTLLTNLNASTVGSYVVVDAGHIMVTIVGSTLPTVASGHTGSIVIGVANQVGPLAPTASQATATLNITYSPVIYGITSTASYIQPTAVGASPSFAPYELISIFGDNFGPTGSATASATFDAFGKVVSPMTVVPASGSVKAVTMSLSFKDVATGHTTYTAPALFANQNQINAVVPGLVSGDQYVTVTVGTTSSDTFLVHILPADPGIFTINSDGTGQGAIINPDLSVNNSSHVAKPNDIISIYMTGLGTPDSTADDAAPSIATSFPNTCVAISNATTGHPGYMQWVNTKATGYTPPTAWTNIDGAELLYGPHNMVVGSNPADQLFPPCMATAAITVTFGPAGNQVVASGTAIKYAGFVSSSVAGLYQVNVQIPASLTPNGGTLLTGATPMLLNITPAGGSTYPSQSGVTVYFQ